MKYVYLLNNQRSKVSINSDETGNEIANKNNRREQNHKNK